MDNNEIMKKTEKKTRHKKPVANVKIIPLGGLAQIGMNMTVIETKDDIIVVDCGIAFPSDDMPGVDKIIPDITYLKRNIDKVRGFVITHGHEDHIGALPYVLKELAIPVYGTRLTIELIRDKLNKEGVKKHKTHIVNFGSTIELGNLQVEFIKTNHSIQDAAALAITTPVGKIIHTGDFKVDYTPVFGDRIDLPRFSELGQEGILAVLSDSTNATKTGFTMSEKTVGEKFDTIFATHTDRRIIIASYASNVDRVQQVLNIAAKYGRKVAIDGRSMKNTISIASKLGYVTIPDDTYIDTDKIECYEDKELVIVATGSQGESMAALSRMSRGTHRFVSIGENDVIVFSSNPIPGNEKAVAEVINHLSEQHAEVIFQDAHVSGHACQEDLKLLYSLLRPKYAVPVHGDYRQRYAAKETIMKLGIEENNVYMLKDGDILTFTKKAAMVGGPVANGKIVIDMMGEPDIDGRALTDRQKLSNGGIIIISLNVDNKTKKWIPKPVITSLGITRSDGTERLFTSIKEEIKKMMDTKPVCPESEQKSIRNRLNRDLEHFIHEKTRLDTIVFSTITEVGGFE